MAWFENIGAALASKGAAALAASVLMVGGGVAVAQSGVGLDTAEENLPEEVGVGLDTARENIPDRADVDLDDLFPFARDGGNVDAVTEVEPELEVQELDVQEIDVQELDVQEIVDLDIAANVEGRSETADRVHGALTGDEEVGPGHEDFGPTVSERAQEEGPLGADVSSAARGDDEDTEGGDASPGASGTTPGPPEEVPGPPANPGPNG